MIPTPADLARRPAPPRPPAAAATPAPAPAPVRVVDLDTLLPGEALRPYYQQAIRFSGMLPHSRLVALTLLGAANHKTGVMTRHLSGVEQLAEATGLTAAQVAVQLEVLRQRGWLDLRTLSRGPRKGDQVWQVRIPGPALRQVRAMRRTTSAP